MTWIDELEGVDMAEAVALAQGMRHDTARKCWFHGPDGDARRWYIDDGPMVWSPATGEMLTYRPDRDIAQAFELDGEGWLWNMSEWSGGVRMNVSVDGTFPGAWAQAQWENYSTKARAYATARCRVYLKAMAERTGTRESGIMATLENQDGMSVFVNLRTRGDGYEGIDIHAEINGKKYNIGEFIVNSKDELEDVSLYAGPPGTE